MKGVVFILEYKKVNRAKEANELISEGWIVDEIIEKGDDFPEIRLHKKYKEQVECEKYEGTTAISKINGFEVRPIYGGKYYASYDGYIYSNVRKEIVKLKFGKTPCRNARKERTGEYYKSVYLYKDGKGKNFPVHRIIAKVFLPNPNKFNCVNHKDGNKLNNHVENLEWCSNAHNVRHAYENNLINLYRKGNKCKRCGKGIVDFNKSGLCDLCRKKITLEERAEIFSDNPEVIEHIKFLNDVKLKLDEMSMSCMELSRMTGCKYQTMLNYLNYRSSSELIKQKIISVLKIGATDVEDQ